MDRAHRALSKVIRGSSYIRSQSIASCFSFDVTIRCRLGGTHSILSLNWQKDSLCPAHSICGLIAYPRVHVRILRQKPSYYRWWMETDPAATRAYLIDWSFQPAIWHIIGKQYKDKGSFFIDIRSIISFDPLCHSCRFVSVVVIGPWPIA